MHADAPASKASACLTARTRSLWSRQAVFSATAIAVSHLLPASATAEKVDRKLVVRAQVEAATLWRKGYVVEDAQVDSML